ncbi:MAG: HAMP domain-containing sensor histidine kinase [Actinomycetota bacterium]|nr:HAMP domain-containing sensor histidine kinase [Actinomycetota bacterium]
MGSRSHILVVEDEPIIADADRRQKEFIANASHELRTPVAALQGTLENLVDGVGTPNRATLGRMLAQSEQLGRLVNQLLDLSRLEAGADRLSTEELDLGDLLHGLARDFRLTHPTSQIEVKAPRGLRTVGDREQVTRVLTNVIGNALRFSPIDAPITIVASRLNGSVRMAVRDAGPGIPFEQRSKVFERFWQADGTPTGGGGAGLGLAISKAIVDRHGGEILIIDNQPNGACVVVTLPAIS